jgi:hypothetical protein
VAPAPWPMYTDRSFTMPSSKVIASIVSGGLLAVSGLACHSSSPASTTTTPTTPSSGPTVMLSSASLTFMGLGTQTVTLTNSGSGDLAITSIVAGGNFTETDNCAGQSVAVGAGCSINVSFVLATASPGSSSGAVTITDNAASSPQSVSLSGPGVAPPGGVLSPATLTFGAQPIGTSSSPQTVMLTNSASGSAAPLVITRIATTTGIDFAVTQNTQNPCPSSLAHGLSCSISVTFAPTASGTRTDALNVFDNANAGLSIQITQLSGTGQ